jgi:Outer membrane efflux protein
MPVRRLLGKSGVGKLGFLLCGCFTYWGHAQGTDLLATYRMALQNDPTILEADANRRAAMESKPQVISLFLPQLTANGVVQQERDKGTSNLVETAQVNGENVSEAFPFDGRVATGEHHYGVDLRQNLFNWRNWAALKSADSQVAQANIDYQAAKEDLILRVAQRYFDVLAAHDDLDVQEANLASGQSPARAGPKALRGWLCRTSPTLRMRALPPTAGPRQLSPQSARSPQRKSCCAK